MQEQEKIPVWVQIVKKMTLMPAWRLALLVSSISVIPLYFTNTLILSAIAVVAVAFEDGAHDWDFWDRHLQKFFDDIGG